MRRGLPRGIIFQSVLLFIFLLTYAYTFKIDRPLIRALDKFRFCFLFLFLSRLLAISLTESTLHTWRKGGQP